MKYFTFLLITVPCFTWSQDKPDLLTMLEKDTVKPTTVNATRYF